MKLHRTKNLFTPIIEIENEYYLIDFVPKWWEMFFGLWRCAVFSYPAKKITKEELSEYSIVMTNKRNSISATFGVGSTAFGISLARFLNNSNVSFCPLVYFLFVIGVHILCFLLFNLYLKRKNYQRMSSSEHKIKFRVQLLPIEKFIVYIFMTLFVYMVQWIHIQILLSWIFESNYSLPSLFNAMGSVVSWWFSIVYFTIPTYGELIISEKRK